MKSICHESDDIGEDSSNFVVRTGAEWDWGSGSLVDQCMPFHLYNYISIVEVGENKYYRGDEVSQMIVNLYKPYSLTR